MDGNRLSDDSVPFTIDFRPMQRRDAQGVLSSPLLDREVFPSQSTEISIDRAISETGDIVPSAFQMESVRDFLFQQAKVRAALEQALITDREAFATYNELPPISNIWEEVSNVLLEVPVDQRRSWSKMRSCFQISFELRYREDDETGHGNCMINWFRDGVLTGSQVE